MGSKRKTIEPLGIILKCDAADGSSFSGFDPFYGPMTRKEAGRLMSKAGLSQMNDEDRWSCRCRDWLGRTIGTVEYKFAELGSLNQLAETVRRWKS